MAESIRLVVGLGNPGPEYTGTRHNVGFGAVDLFAQEHGAVWERRAKWHAALAKADSVILLKPLSFMNRSGDVVAAVSDFYKIVPEAILVVLDDFALPLGRLRMRERGGPGGHNGLESVIVSLATEEIPRLRLGIGAAPQRSSVDYVLSRFFEEEKSQAREMIQRASTAIACVIDKGITSAMNTFNAATNNDKIT